jgi:hypothetical protein
VTAPLSTRREYDRLTFYRATLLWLHLICALAVGITYLSIQDFSHLAYWSRGGSFAVLIIAAIPMLPYWMSGYRSRLRVSYHRMGFWTFCIIILLGTCVAGYLYLFVPILRAGLAVVGLSIAQMVVYLFAIGSCLGNDVMPKP